MRVHASTMAACVRGAEEEHCETRLMKCHLLARLFEEAVASHVAATAPALDAKRLTGEYTPAPRTRRCASISAVLA
ncbi:hypothetical protein [Sphingomonas sp. BAUL-RG-20F-R05-02]|uniref:hypothetical protein n=1 Tax=Sphingomonas sp. BAUL-RG-20F-R05-02 TaxID=2914830 RepID=UPI001F5768AB|nr:hypothetical protein [Sphingomonas sp. BAUL-RG-20F-R05-02]